jgi:hypothetical protein
MNSNPAPASMSLLTVSGNKNGQPHFGCSLSHKRTALALCAHLDVIDVFAVAGRAAATKLYEVAKLAAVAKLVLLRRLFCLTPRRSLQLQWIGSLTLPLSGNLSKSGNASQSLSLSVFVHFWFCLVLILVAATIFPPHLATFSPMHLATYFARFVLNFKFGSSTLNLDFS